MGDTKTSYILHAYAFVKSLSLSLQNRWIQVDTTHFTLSRSHTITLMTTNKTVRASSLWGSFVSSK